MHLKIEEIGRMLRTGDLGIPANPADRYVCFHVLYKVNACVAVVEVYAINVPSDIIIIKILSVCPSVRNGTLPTFTGNRVDPKAFSLSHNGLEAASGMPWKATA